MNWIICKITAAGIESVVDDFAMCITHTNCPELSLVRDALLLLKPTIDDMDGVVGKSLTLSHLQVGRSFPGKGVPLCLPKRNFFLGHFS